MLLFSLYIVYEINDYQYICIYQTAALIICFATKILRQLQIFYIKTQYVIQKTN